MRCLFALAGPMKTTIHVGAVTAVLAVTVLTVAAQGVNRQLATTVVAERRVVRLGDAIKVSVRVTNQAPQEVKVDRSATAFGCFEVKDPDGHVVPYVGFDGQVVSFPIVVRPMSEVTIADALDVTDKYIFQKAGRYSIRLTEGATGLPASPAITVDVKPGQLSGVDQLAGRLLLHLPEGWHVAKDGHGEVAPFGRSEVRGCALHVCRNHMRGEAVYLWFTETEAMMEPDQDERGRSHYLGRACGFYIYAAVGSQAPALWPTATEDISRALKITSETGDVREEAAVLQSTLNQIGEHGV